jgi:hypothetical protein
MILYRPIGVQELLLIRGSGFTSFPPRLPHQPVFYPVLNRDYAEQIAREWNTQDLASGFAGFVTRFEVSDEVVAKYEIRSVGSKAHRELWVPAEELQAFNHALIGKIEVVAAFYGQRYSGDPDLHVRLLA